MNICRKRRSTPWEFKDSQPFIDACGIYYGVGFEDYLKQVRFIYPDLDLSKFTLDKPASTTPGGGDIADEESDDSTHIEEQDPKDDGVVLAQPVPNGPIAPLVPSAEDPSTQNAENLSALDAPPT